MNMNSGYTQQVYTPANTVPSGIAQVGVAPDPDRLLTEGDAAKGSTTSCNAPKRSLLKWHTSGRHTPVRDATNGPRAACILPEPTFGAK
jgi:hypothetical protein